MIDKADDEIDDFNGDKASAESNLEDAKEYLLENYKNFDFIWASPPCQTHSRIRKAKVDCKENKYGSTEAIYPDIWKACQIELEKKK
jgi:site-specific DNA-cytosine methylase